MSDSAASGFTPISQLGEFALIDRITDGFTIFSDQVFKGIGDDAAVLDIGNDKVQLLSSDSLFEGVHFDLAYAPLKHLGYKAVTSNLSDIAAMNGKALGILVNIGVSNRFVAEALDELYAGIKLACERYQVTLLGGDTSSSKQGLIISVTAVGECKKSEVVYRSGANDRDLICVSGDLGSAYAGLQILEREKAVFVDKPDLQPDLNDFDYVVGRQLKPEARFDVLDSLRERGITITSMMDVSDGIASELHHLCKQSGTGAEIYTSKLPIDHQTMKVADEFKIGSATFALNGGEDYELIFTIPLSDFDRIKDLPDISIIGNMTENRGIVQAILDDGSVSDVQAQGWQHFS